MKLHTQSVLQSRAEASSTASITPCQVSVEAESSPLEESHVWTALICKRQFVGERSLTCEGSQTDLSSQRHCFSLAAHLKPGEDFPHIMLDSSLTQA